MHALHARSRTRLGTRGVVLGCEVSVRTSIPAPWAGHTRHTCYAVHIPKEPQLTALPATFPGPCRTDVVKGLAQATLTSAVTLARNGQARNKSLTLAAVRRIGAARGAAGRKADSRAVATPPASCSSPTWCATSTSSIGSWSCPRPSRSTDDQPLVAAVTLRELARRRAALALVLCEGTAVGPTTYKQMFATHPGSISNRNVT